MLRLLGSLPQRFRAAAVAGAASLALTAGASANLLPPGFEITCTWGDTSWKATNNQDLFSSKYDAFGGVVQSVGPIIGDGWTFEGVGGLPGFITTYSTNPTQTNAFTFTNTTGMTNTFTITITTPGSISGPTLMHGSIAGGITDNTGTGAMFSAPAGGAVYTALIDGVSTGQTLWNDPYSVTTSPPILTGSLGAENFTNAPGPGVLSSIAIQHTFTLSAGDSVTINSAFQVVPAPAGLAVLAGGFIFGRRRRR